MRCLGCGSLTHLPAATCADCGSALPRGSSGREATRWGSGGAPRPPGHLVASIPVRCAECGDVDYGPWLVRDEAALCEHCNARRASYSTRPANLTLEQYRRVDPFSVELLVREFGEEAALRLLNGKPAPTREVVPFDPGLLAPPGAVGVPCDHRNKRRRYSGEAL